MRIIRVDPVESGDSKPRYRLQWKQRKFAIFITPEQLKHLTWELLLQIKEDHFGVFGGSNQKSPKQSGISREVVTGNKGGKPLDESGETEKETNTA